MRSLALGIVLAISLLTVSESGVSAAGPEGNSEELVVVIVRPSTNAHVNRNVTVEASVSSTEPIASVSFTAGSSSGEMTPDPSTGNWSGRWPTVDSPDGPYVIRVTATAVGGLAANASQPVTVDNTPPELAFVSPAENAFVRGTIPISWIARDTNLFEVTLTVSGTTLRVTGLTGAVINTVTLVDGPQYFTLSSIDFALNVATVMLRVYVDNTGPSVILTSPASDSYLRGLIFVEFATYDANLRILSLSVGPFVTYNVTGRTSLAVDTTAIPDGRFVFSLVAVDWVGNHNTSASSVTVDNTPPVVSIAGAREGAFVEGIASIRWTVEDANLDRVWVGIDGEWRDLTGSPSLEWDTTRVRDGLHSISVRAVDRAGNEATVSVSVVVANLRPVSTILWIIGAAIVVGIIVAAALHFRKRRART